MRITGAFLIVSLMFVSSALADDPPRPTHAGELQLDEVDFKPVQGDAVKADWGEIAVPELHGSNSDRVLRLTLVRFRSTAKEPGAPIVYLEGGPGVSGTNSAFGFLFPVIQQLRAVADVVVIDQRGSGRSEPPTSCDARVIDFLGDDLSEAAMKKTATGTALACAKKLEAAGTNLQSLTTDETADDLETLRVALKVKRINLLSFSYGTHAAAAFARRHPESLERIVLAGPALPDELLKLPSEQEAHAAYVASLAGKDLLRLMRKVHTSLDRKPITLELQDPAIKSIRKVTLHGYALQWLTASALGKREFVAALPLLYTQIARGDTTLLRDFASSVFFGRAPRATNFLVRCAAIPSAKQLARVRRERSGALLSDAINFPEPELCHSLPHGTTDLHRPFKFTRPALVVVGMLDANAPPVRASQLRRWFPNSAALKVENAGHNDLLTYRDVRKHIALFFAGLPITDERVASEPLAFLPVP